MLTIKTDSVQRSVRSNYRSQFHNRKLTIMAEVGHLVWYSFVSLNISNERLTFTASHLEQLNQSFNLPYDHTNNEPTV